MSYLIEGSCLTRDGFGRRRIGVSRGRIVEPVTEWPLWTLSDDHFLIPAFHDHHTHLVGTFRPAQGPALDGIATRQGTLDALSRWLDERPGTGPVLGEGWDESVWDDPRPLTGADIDRICADRPIGLRRVDGHMAGVNAAAWRELSPEGPEADVATRTLTEGLAMGLPSRWTPSSDAYLEGVRAGQLEASRRGVAAVDEMGRLEIYRAFLSHAEAGSLNLRVRHFFPLEKLEGVLGAGLRAGDRVGTLQVFGLKGFLDGSIGARTAAMAEPFVDRGDSGSLLWETEALSRAVRSGTEAGFSIALHAIGRRAVAQALEAFERAGGRHHGLELRVEHAEEVDAATLDRAGDLGVALSMQPNFTARWQGHGGMYERALGPERTRGLNPYASAAARTRLLFGSDTMPFGPLDGIRGALGHPDAEERLTATQAISAYASCGLERGHSTSPLGPGQDADLAIVRALGGDLEGAILGRSAEVVWTALAGCSVWESSGLPIPDDVREASR